MSATSNPITNKAGLIVTFYGRRDQMLPLQKAVGIALGLVQAQTDNEEMLDPHRRIFLSRFDPPLAHDTTIVQLAISEADPNEPDDALTVWGKMRRELEIGELSRILDEAAAKKNEAGQSIFWGYSLIYHAVLADGVSLDEHREKLLGLAYRPDSKPWDRPVPLAQTKILGTDLWLMDIPNEGDGAKAATVYVALSPLDREDDMIIKVLYGRGALLLMPDLIAHKGYNQKRQYVGDPLTPDKSPRRGYKNQINDLQQMIGPFLGFNPQSGSSRAQSGPKEWARLKSLYAQLLYATSILDEPRLSLAQQLENYAWWKDKLGKGDLGTYHYRQMQTAFRELELLIDKGQRMLEAAGTAIDMEQTELNQKREQREKVIGALIAILGIGLAISQTVDATAAAALLNWYHNGSALSPASFKRLVELSVQLIPLLVIGLMAGYWAYRKWH